MDRNAPENGEARAETPAAGAAPQRARRGAVRRIAAAAGVTLGAAVAFVVLFVGAVQIAAWSGWGADRLSTAAQRTISDLNDRPVDTRIGTTRLSLDGWRPAIELRDVRVVDRESGRMLLEAGRIGFGLNPRPLLSGRIELDSASVSGARFDAGALGRREGPGLGDRLENANGAIDAGRAVQAIYGALHSAFGLLESGRTRRIALSDVALTTGAFDAGALHLARLTVTQPARGTVAFAGEAAAGERRIALEGTAERPAGSDAIGAVTARLEIPQPQEGPASWHGALVLAVTGQQVDGPGSGRLTAELSLDDAELRLGPEDTLAGDARLRLVAKESAPIVLIERGRFETGRSLFDLRGAVGPLPGQQADEPPRYGFEVVSARSVVAPLDSPEPALPIRLRLVGTYDPGAGRLAADVIDVRTSAGGLRASAALTFREGATPGLSLALSLEALPVGHTKQLWPWFAASGARAWVLDNVFGGRVVDSSLRLRVPPGRLGNGEPLDASEVSGRFAVESTRFDVAGRIPPVRDGGGVVAFQGTDVDIALSSGTVFMPSGRTVETANGTFVIDQAHLTPLVGRLDIDVEGMAPAIVELASYDPINASRFIDLAAEDVSGQVEGRVFAEIPLSEDARDADLDWRVALDYSDLALAEPFEGQMVTEAAGTLVVGPEWAEIEATARLSGARARLEIVEPLAAADGAAAAERRRIVEIDLDAEARERLVPGLSTILGGTARVRLERIDAGHEAVEVALADATLSLPWVGWRKGAGVPATARFVMETDGAQTQLEDFTLEGETFSAAGSVTLDAGALQSARFATLRLNRGDEMAVAIRRDGRGYRIDADGRSFDVRALIRSVLDSDGQGGGGGEATPITLEAELGQLVGFNGETLSGVRVSYRDTGGGGSGLSVSAATGGGGSVTASDSTDAAGARSLRMQSTDAGSVLRFLDLYEHMVGGAISLQMAGSGRMSGQVDARDFWIVNEPRLRSLVAATPQGDSRATGRDGQPLDASRVRFDRGFAQVTRADGFLGLERGVLRGPLMGTTFQGTLYDPAGNMAITGTFMPAYGVNRIFGELPLIGEILGNGRDRGLIGITYRLAGRAGEPRLQINPISAIAPGILRQIFEFR